ncbi:hypothetical protein D018_0677A, partial [Vibrio parahaemolyticus VP2007-007]
MLDVPLLNDTASQALEGGSTTPPSVDTPTWAKAAVTSLAGKLKSCAAANTPAAAES